MHVKISLSSSLIAYPCIQKRFQYHISLMIMEKKVCCCPDVDNTAVHTMEYFFIKKKTVYYIFGVYLDFNFVDMK